VDPPPLIRVNLPAEHNGLDQESLARIVNVIRPKRSRKQTTYANMEGTHMNNMRLLLPDTCWNTELISGAVFLYFNENLGFTLHPSVSTFMTGIDPFDFARYVETKKPVWCQKFAQFFDYWRAFESNLRRTTELIEPLRISFKMVMLSYDRGSNAWQEARDLLSAVPLPLKQIESLIDPFSAADELFAHIFFEKYLELYFAGASDAELVAMGQRAGKAGGALPRVNVDWGMLYNYCETLFHSQDLHTLLTTAYLFRLPLFRYSRFALLSNPGLVPLLSSLQVQRDVTPEQGEAALDCVSWEIFRQLVSEHCDPLSRARVSGLVDLLSLT